MPDAPFGVEGADGSFWLRYNDHIDVLNGDFTVTGQIPLPIRTNPTQSQNGDWIAVNDGGKLSIYRVGETSPTATLVLPPNTSVVDVNTHAVLVNGKFPNSCYVGVWETGGDRSWNLNFQTPTAFDGCVSGVVLLSENAVLVRNSLGDRLEVVHRDGSVETLSDRGKLLWIAISGRIALQTFQPSHLAQVLDMDFGGQKEITVYDPSSKSIIFRKTIGGQSGAALAPDGNHLAIVEGSSLLIYSLP